MTDANLPEAPPRSSRNVVLVFVAIGALVAAGASAFFAQRARASHEGDAAIADDVPRLDGHAIVFSEAFAKRSGIADEPVKRSPLVPMVSVPGSVTFDAQHVSAAGTRIRGFVRQVFKVEGDVVRKGEALAEIESGELGQAQAQVTAFTAKNKAAERNARREADLLSQGLTTAREEEVARADLDEQRAMLSAASQRAAALGGMSARGLGTYLVHSPMDGTVVERSISAGQSVESDLIAFRVADLGHLWIELHVFEREIGSLRTGDRAEITPAGAGQSKIEGKVAYVGELIDANTRSGEVRLKTENSAHLLRPGQSVVARVYPSALARDVLSVPLSAVTYVDGSPHVFAILPTTDGNTVRRVIVTPVKLGLSDGERQAIIEGLTDGQRVVVSGVFALKSELFR